MLMGLLLVSAEKASSDTAKLLPVLPGPPTPTPPPPASYTYTVNFRDIYIRNTRSRHTDTDYATVKIRVGSQTKEASAYIGDLNNGPKEFDLTIPNIVIPADDTAVVLAISVTNSGHDPGAEALANAISSILPDAADAILPGSGDFVSLFTQAINLPGLLAPNCDGPVIIARTGPFRGADIAALSKAGTWWALMGTDYGYDSAGGCGSNSNYGYTAILTRSPSTGFSVK
jgi:hypothetical protein